MSVPTANGAFELQKVLHTIDPRYSILHVPDYHFYRELTEEEVTFVKLSVPETNVRKLHTNLILRAPT